MNSFMKVFKFDESEVYLKNACVQAKIIKKADKKIYLRIWNSGRANAYNVNFFVPKGNKICILRSHLDYRILEPGRAFDEYAIADESVGDEVSIITYWEDEFGTLYSREQQGNMRKLRIG